MKFSLLHLDYGHPYSKISVHTSEGEIGKLGNGERISFDLNRGRIGITLPVEHFRILYMPFKSRRRNTDSFSAGPQELVQQKREVSSL